jgi:hypothetical protein
MRRLCTDRMRRASPKHDPWATLLIGGYFFRGCVGACAPLESRYLFFGMVDRRRQNGRFECAFVCEAVFLNWFPCLLIPLAPDI